MGFISTVKVVQFDDLFIHTELENSEVRVAMPFMNYHRGGSMKGMGVVVVELADLCVFFFLAPRVFGRLSFLQFRQFFKRTIWRD
jgi:hypothetical protein